MEETQQHKVHHQVALFSLDLPFQPYGCQMIYIETNVNKHINAYFRENTTKVADIIGKQFIYLPVLLEDVAQVVDYNWPGTDPARIEEAKPDSSWYLDTYREILSYRIGKEEVMPELPMEISESPLIIRYEHTTATEHIFTLFPLQYSDDKQFEELLKAIADEPCWDSDTMCSTIIEHPLHDSSDYTKGEVYSSTITEEIPQISPRDHADYGDIDRLANEIKQRIGALRLMGVSDYVIRRLICLPEPKLSKLLITKDYRLFLTDYNKMEITMPTLSKVVFFFYLRHPEGLRFKELIDYRDELLYIYYRISNRGEVEKMEQSIDELVDSTRNSINEKCSRIRAAFVSRFNDDLAKNYYITYGEGNAKHIALDRVFVIDESGIITNKS